MKKSVALIMICASLLQAKNEYELFLQGNKAYRHHEASKALHAYEQISNKGPATWYNMGNCYYKQGDVSHAHLCWLRSQRNASWSQLCAIDQRLACITENAPRTFFQSMKYALVRFVLSTSWLALQLLLLMFLYLLLLVYKRRSLSRSYVFLIIAGLLISLFLIIGKYSISTKKYAVILQPQAKIYAGPDERYHALDTVQSGDCVRIHTTDDNWYKISHGKKIGWVLADSLAVVY